MCCRVKLQTKNIHRAKPKAPHVESSKTDPNKAEAFLGVLEESFFYLPQSCLAQQYWDGLQDIIQITSMTAFGKQLRRSNDSFKANSMGHAVHGCSSGSTLPGTPANTHGLVHPNMPGLQPIKLDKTKMLGQDTESPLSITINNYTLETESTLT